MNDMSWNSRQGGFPIEPDDGEGLDAPRKEWRIGGAIAGLFFVGLLGWAALTPLDAGAFAEGQVAVSGNRQAVQHREGGIVTELKVVEGQMVRKGQALLKVSASETLALERGLTGEVVALLALRARLLAERDGLGHVADPLEYRSLPAGDQDLAQDALQGQRLLFQARRNSIATERNVLTQKIGQHNEQISGTRSQITSNRLQEKLTDD